MKMNPIATNVKTKTRVSIAVIAPAKPHTNDTSAITYENKAKKERKDFILNSPVEYNICYK
jgi:hypothetical protein